MLAFVADDERAQVAELVRMITVPFDAPANWDEKSFNDTGARRTSPRITMPFSSGVQLDRALPLFFRRFFR